MENIVLIGFMGSGKSTVGREIAIQSGRFLLDTDDLIAQNMGKSVSEIFQSVGESGFRQIESQLITWLTHNVRNAIIATGGGMPIHNNISALGKIFWLDVGFEDILSRMTPPERAKRPLFKDTAKAQALFDQRRKIYEGQSHFIVGGNAQASAIAAEILKSFENLKLEKQGFYGS